MKRPPASLVWEWVHTHAKGNPIVRYDEETDYFDAIGFDHPDDEPAFLAWLASLEGQ